MSSSDSAARNAPDARRIVPIQRVTGWDRVPGLIAGFCGRAGGVSTGAFAALNLSSRVGDDTQAVRQNWQRVAAAVGEGLRFATMQQVHGAEVVTVRDGGEVGEADGMITDAPRLVLCVLTADCAPVLLVAPRRGVIGVVHAGWRGTLAGVALRALRELQDVFQVEPDAVHVALGPTIGPCCYEVGVDMVDALERSAPETAAAIRRGPAGDLPHGKARLDLRGANAMQLLGAGIPASQLVMVGPCTRCASAEYYSYRAARAPLASGITGRQLSFIGWQE